MATHDYVIDNSTGANVRADINNALAAIVSNNSNSSEPATKYAYQWWADTNAAILKIRNSSNNGWINLFTLAGGIDVDAASNFNEDVTFTGATSGRNIVFDRSDNALEFADNAKATFGSSADLAIYHEGNHSYIQDQGTGSLILVGNTIAMQNAAQSENMFAATENSFVSLYFDNVLRSRTSSSGLDVFNTIRVLGDTAPQIQFNTDTSLGTGTRAMFGMASAANNFVNGSAANDMCLNLPEDFIISNGTTEFIAEFRKNDKVALYFDSGKKIETNSGGAHVTGQISSTPSSSSTRGANFNSYVVDQSAAAQSVATVKANSNMGVVLDLNRFYTTGNIVEFRINNDFEGNIVVSPSGVSYNTTSDYRLKENVVTLSDGITRLKQLKPYRFNFIAEPSVLNDGFFAHEVSSIVPSAVSGEKDATEIRYYEEGDILPSGKVIGDIKDENSVVPQSLDYAKIVPLITAALQESIAKIEVLETKVAALEAA